MKLKATALALVAAFAAAGTAQADVSYFSIDRQHGNSSNFELGLVRSAADGVIEIYENNGDVQGDLLGSTRVNAGANLNVKVDLGRTVHATELVAILRSGDTILATKEIDVSQ